MKMTNQKLETALELALSVPSSVRAKSPSLETGYSPETQSWELIIRYFTGGCHPCLLVWRLWNPVSARKPD